MPGLNYKVSLVTSLQTLFFMKQIEVVAGILCADHLGKPTKTRTPGYKIFATKRGYGEFKGFWEFPGGKVEQGESLEAALIRELKEELSKNYGDDKEKQRKLDLLRYQVCEIENANLKKGEEEELIEKEKLILASEKIAKNLQEALNQIDEKLADIEKKLKANDNKQKEYNKTIKNTQDILRETMTGDVAGNLGKAGEDVVNVADQLRKATTEAGVTGNSLVKLNL